MRTTFRVVVEIKCRIENFKTIHRFMTSKIQVFLHCILEDAQLAFLIFISISSHRLSSLYNIVSLPMFLLIEGLKYTFLVNCLVLWSCTDSSLVSELQKIFGKQLL